MSDSRQEVRLFDDQSPLSGRVSRERVRGEGDLGCVGALYSHSLRQPPLPMWVGVVALGRFVSDCGRLKRALAIGRAKKPRLDGSKGRAGVVVVNKMIAAQMASTCWQMGQTTTL